MKSRTYARLSLLIPFLLWLILLIYSLALSSLSAEDVFSNVSIPVGEWVSRVIAFYVIGIMFWIFPYLLLGAILFSMTFIWESRILIRVFALSPLPMTLLTLALTTLVVFWGPGEGTFTSNVNLQDFNSFNILVSIFILTWGYVCVGIGLGLYKLLQYLQVIKDNVSTGSNPGLANS